MNETNYKFCANLSQFADSAQTVILDSAQNLHAQNHRIPWALATWVNW